LEEDYEVDPEAKSVEGPEYSLDEIRQILAAASLHIKVKTPRLNHLPKPEADTRLKHRPEKQNPLFVPNL
jgi:hypothetical protein